MRCYMNERIFEYLESFGDDEIATWSIGFDKWWNRWCDKLNLPYDICFYDFTLALGDYLYPNGVSYPPNRAERRKLKRKKR